MMEIETRFYHAMRHTDMRLNLLEEAVEHLLMTPEERAFSQGVEEGFVRAAELTADPEAILRQFRPVLPEFERRSTVVTGGRQPDFGK